jgi:predicted proteasome-type protease
MITTSWHAQSPDLNFIENIWLRIKRTLETRAEDQLMAEIRTAWENVPTSCIEDL